MSTKHYCQQNPLGIAIFTLSDPPGFHDETRRTQVSHYVVQE